MSNGEPLLPTMPLDIAARACIQQTAFEINLIGMLSIRKPTKPFDYFIFN